MILLSLATFLLLPAVAAFSALLCLTGVLMFGLPLWLGHMAARRWQVLPPMLVESEGLSILKEGTWQLVRWVDVTSVRRSFYPDRFVFRGRDGTTLFEIDSAVPYMEQMAMALIAAARDGNVPEQGIHEHVSLGAHEVWIVLILPGCVLIAIARVWATLSGECASPFALVASALLGALLVATPWLVHRRHALVVLRP